MIMDMLLSLLELIGVQGYSLTKSLRTSPCCFSLSLALS